MLNETNHIISSDKISVVHLSTGISLQYTSGVGVKASGRREIRDMSDNEAFTRRISLYEP